MTFWTLFILVVSLIIYFLREKNPVLSKEIINLLQTGKKKAAFLLQDFTPACQRNIKTDWMCLLACQWQRNDSTDTCSLSVWARKGYCNKVSCRISESKLCSRQSQEQNQVKEIQSNKKRAWHTTVDSNPAIIQQIWKKKSNAKCKFPSLDF